MKSLDQKGERPMLGSRLKEIREKKNITINELSQRSSVSKSYISSIERGLQQNPSLEIIQKLSSALDVSLDAVLLEGDEELAEWITPLKQAIEGGLTKKDFLGFLKGWR